VLVVASAVALSVTVELVSRAREAAVANQFDSVGPALRILPAGATPHSILRDDAPSPSLLPGTVEAILRLAGADLAALEQRRIAWGQCCCTVKVGQGFFRLGKLKPGEATLMQGRHLIGL
jgi:hypothetical protein